MTVVRPNSIAGINSITVQTGQALNIHDASGNLIRNITSSTGISTFQSLHVGAGTTTSTQGISVGTGCSIVSTTVNQLELYTNSSQRLKITSGGLITQSNTWTNTYSATDTTHCGYQVHNISDTTDTYAALRLTTGSSSPATAQIASVRKGTGQNDLTFQVEASNTAKEVLRLDSAGQVQINTDGSQTASNISVGAGADLKIYHDGSDSYIRNISATDLRIQNIGNAGIDIYNQNSYPIRFTTNGNEIMRITNSSVGIGTDASASSAKFQVVEPDSTECYIQVANQTTGYDANSGLLIGYNGSEVAKIMNLENTAMELATNGNARITIANDGHVTLSNAISFNAETATANRLDDYEEGSWTGVIVTGGGTVSGEWYTKIGNIVFVTATLSAWGDTTSSTQITVSGFPFTCSATGFGICKFCKHEDAHKGPWIEVSGTTGGFLKSSTSTGSCDYVYHSGIVQSSGSAAFSVWYNVA